MKHPIRPSTASQQRLVDAWNAQHPIGTPVRIWPVLREGPGIETKTRSEAQLLGAVAVVWTAARPSMALTHVEARSPALETA